MNIEFIFMTYSDRYLSEYVKSASTGPSDIAELFLKWPASYVSWTVKLHGKPLIMFHSMIGKLVQINLKKMAFVIIIVPPISLTLWKPPNFPMLSIIIHFVVCFLYENVFRMCMRRIPKTSLILVLFPV